MDGDTKADGLSRISKFYRKILFFIERKFVVFKIEGKSL